MQAPPAPQGPAGDASSLPPAAPAPMPAEPDPGMGDEEPMPDEGMDTGMDDLTKRVVDTMKSLTDKDKETISAYADSLRDSSENAADGEMPAGEMPAEGGEPMPMQETFIFTKKQIREMNEMVPLTDKEEDGPHTAKETKSLGKNPFDSPDLNENDLEGYGISNHIDKGEEKLNEGVNNDPEYTHYVVNKQTGMIVFGYDYNGVEKEDRKYYTRLDMEDNGWNPSEYKLVNKDYLMRQGINPDDDSVWAQN